MNFNEHFTHRIFRSRPAQAGDRVAVYSGREMYGARGKVIRIDGAQALVVVGSKTIRVPLCDLEVVS